MQVYAAQCHTSSVNSVSFAPHELGLVVAAASSDGSLSVLTHQPDGSWQTEKVRGRSGRTRESVTQLHGCRAFSYAVQSRLGMR